MPCSGCHCHRIWFPVTNWLPSLHNALSNDNVKWYFRDNSSHGWSIVWCQPEQLCLSSRHGYSLHRVHILVLHEVCDCHTDLCYMYLINTKFSPHLRATQNLLQASSQGPPVSAVVYMLLLVGGLCTVRPEPLRLFSEFGAVYKYSDLLTYLLNAGYAFICTTGSPCQESLCPCRRYAIYLFTF